MLVNELAELGTELRGISDCEVNAHAPVAAARTESDMKGSDDRLAIIVDTAATFKTSPSRLLTHATIEPGTVNFFFIIRNPRRVALIG